MTFAELEPGQRYYSCSQHEIHGSVVFVCLTLSEA